MGDRNKLHWPSMENRGTFTVMKLEGKFHFWSNNLIVAEVNPEDATESLQRLEECIEGKLHCCDCDSPEEEIWFYFAAVYCKRCWVGETGQYKDKGGWKREEAHQFYG